jgi:hypothetical protein
VVVQDSELLFDYGDRYWGAPDKARPVEAAETGHVSADEAPPQRRRVSSGGGQRDDVGWEAQLAKLKTYRAMHGDCSVPSRWAKDPGLANWVGRHRTQKRKLDRGEPSEMTAERAAKLDAFGFDWAPQSGGAETARYDIGQTGGIPLDAKWEAQLAKLAAYKAAHGDCNVPKGWAEDLGLGIWVSKQRRFKKKLDRGEPSPGITVERAARLEALGFSAPTRQATRRDEPEAAPGDAVGRTAAGKCGCAPRDSGPQKLFLWPKRLFTARCESLWKI